MAAKKHNNRRRHKKPRALQQEDQDEPSKQTRDEPSKQTRDEPSQRPDRPANQSINAPYHGPSHGPSSGPNQGTNRPNSGNSRPQGAHRPASQTDRQGQGGNRPSQDRPNQRTDRPEGTNRPNNQRRERSLNPRSPQDQQPKAEGKYGSHQGQGQPRNQGQRSNQSPVKRPGSRGQRSRTRSQGNEGAVKSEGAAVGTGDGASNGDRKEAEKKPEKIVENAKTETAEQKVSEQTEKPIKQTNGPLAVTDAKVNGDAKVVEVNGKGHHENGPKDDLKGHYPKGQDKEIAADVKVNGLKSAEIIYSAPQTNGNENNNNIENDKENKDSNKELPKKDTAKTFSPKRSVVSVNLDDKPEEPLPQRQPRQKREVKRAEVVINGKLDEEDPDLR